MLITEDVSTFPFLNSSVGAGITPHTKPVSRIVSSPVCAKTAFRLKLSLLPETADGVSSSSSRGFPFTVISQLFVLLLPAASYASTITVFTPGVLLMPSGIVYDNDLSASLWLSDTDRASANSFSTAACVSSSKTVIGVYVITGAFLSILSTRTGYTTDLSLPPIL